MTEFDILFEDEHIAVIVKPEGLLSQNDESGDESVVSLLEKRLPYVGVVHRLDRGVSGVMVYAKNKDAAAKLSGIVGDKDVFSKTYLVVCHGKPVADCGEMHDLLFKDRHLNKSYTVERKRKGVKDASLEYTLISYNAENDLSLVKVKLHTGRTHQIRVQFASRKMPLAGDKKYGAKDNFKSIGLFSSNLAFPHPKSGKAVDFGALPDYSKAPWNIFEDEFLKPAAI
jgi:23S rRNA pseudouridine1911/1915/1917 synthase